MTDVYPPKRSEMKQIPSSFLLFRARLVLFWEKAWPALLPILAPVTFLAILSLFDIWRYLPFWAHWGVLGLTVMATVIAILRYHHELDWPDRLIAIQRLEDDSKLPHNPLQALEDAPFGEPDRHSALWQRHQALMVEQARRATLKGTYAIVDQRDHFALRYTALGLLIIGVFAAGSDWQIRLLGMANPTMARQKTASQVDMWVDPPAYTGRAPVYLVGANAISGQTLPALADQINVPAGSKLIAQINGERGVSLTFIDTEGDLIEAETADSDEDETLDQIDVARVTLPLHVNGLIQLKLGRQKGLWPVLVIEDQIPDVAFVAEPETNDKRELKLHYQFTDDYGAKEAYLEFRLNPDQVRPLDAPILEDQALKTVRMVSLEGAAGPSGQRRHDLQLEEDPWAGLEVLAKVVVIDGADQKGETEEVAFTLPSRSFLNPLAKAVIEQRQNLAVATEEDQRVRDALAALTLAPEEFYENTSEYLLLRTAFWRVQKTKEKQYEPVVDHFWPLALELENQVLELARRQLEAAIAALREALERNAGEEEVDTLREKLQQAIQDYLQALAQSGQPQPSGSGEGNTEIGQNDIDRMLNAIGDLSKSGANNAARQMLSDLENLLNNLQVTQGGGGQGGTPTGQPGQGGQSGGPGEQAGDLIGRQRDLSNRSFERGQQPGSSGDDLAQEQNGIGQELRELLENLEAGEGTSDDSLDPDGSARSSLQEALREMQRSEDALQGSDFGTAETAMERAISQLREGAQALAEEQARQQAEDNQNGNNGRGSAGEDSGLDPLGRAIGINGGEVEVPDTLDPARTREVIEELRRRLGEQGRTEEEIEYLERLLQAF